MGWNGIPGLGRGTNALFLMFLLLGILSSAEEFDSSNKMYFKERKEVSGHFCCINKDGKTNPTSHILYLLAINHAELCRSLSNVFDLWLHTEQISTITNNQECSSKIVKIGYGLTSWYAYHTGNDNSTSHDRSTLEPTYIRERKCTEPIPMRNCVTPDTREVRFLVIAYAQTDQYVIISMCKEYGSECCVLSNNRDKGSSLSKLSGKLVQNILNSGYDVISVHRPVCNVGSRALVNSGYPLHIVSVHTRKSTFILINSSLVLSEGNDLCMHSYTCFIDLRIFANNTSPTNITNISVCSQDVKMHFRHIKTFHETNQSTVQDVQTNVDFVALDSDPQRNRTQVYNTYITTKLHAIDTILKHLMSNCKSRCFIVKRDNSQFRRKHKLYFTPTLVPFTYGSMQTDAYRTRIESMNYSTVAEMRNRHLLVRYFVHSQGLFQNSTRTKSQFITGVILFMKTNICQYAFIHAYELMSEEHYIKFIICLIDSILRNMTAYYKASISIDSDAHLYEEKVRVMNSDRSHNSYKKCKIRSWANTNHIHLRHLRSHAAIYKNIIKEKIIHLVWRFYQYKSLLYNLLLQTYDVKMKILNKLLSHNNGYEDNKGFQNESLLSHHASKVERCYVRCRVNCKCGAKHNTVTILARISSIKLLLNESKESCIYVIITWLLLRFLKTHATNVFHCKKSLNFDNFKVLILILFCNIYKHLSSLKQNFQHNHKKYLKLSTKSNNYQRNGSSCERQTFNFKLTKSYFQRIHDLHILDNLSSLLDRHLHTDTNASLHDLSYTYKDDQCVSNGYNTLKNYGRHYLLSLGDIHRSSVQYVYPVYKSILSRHLDDSIGNSSTESSLGFELFRVGTFSKFPGINTPSAIALARSGFYFTGESDTVECFHCHVKYSNWNARDDPLDVHRRISPSCGFINGQASANVPVERHQENAGAAIPQTNGSKHDARIPYQNSLLESTTGCANQSTQSNSPRKSNLRVADSTVHDQQTLQHNPQQESTTRNALANGHRGSLERFSSVQHGAANQGILPRNTSRENRQTISSGDFGTVNLVTQPSQTTHRHKNVNYTQTATADFALMNNANHHTTERNKHNGFPQNSKSGRSSDMGPQQPFNTTSSAAYRPLLLEPLGIVSTPPRYPAYAILSVRMSTFQGWPPTSGQTPKQMAIAGFIFAGYSDYTRCFFCGGGLRNWEPDDDPWIEHAKWFPKCVYVRQNKGDNFVQLVHQNVNNPHILDTRDLNEYQTNDDRLTTGNASSPKSNLGKSCPNTACPNAAAIQSVQEMGYSREVIDSAIEVIHKDEKEVNAFNIMDVILSNDHEITPEPSSSSDVKGHEQEEAGGQSETQSTGNSIDVTSSQLQQISISDVKSLVEENRSLKESRLCKVCLDNEVSIAFVPCGHLACCGECAFAMRKCPICREFVQGRVKTWMP